jgi:hypothetical protein
MFYTKGLCQVLREPRTWVALQSQGRSLTLSSARSYSGLRGASTVVIDFKARGVQEISLRARNSGCRSSSISSENPQQQQLSSSKGGVKAFSSLAAGQETVARTPSEVDIPVAEDEHVPVVLPTNNSSENLLRIRHTVRISDQKFAA